MKFIKRLLAYYKSKEYEAARRQAIKVHHQLHYTYGIHLTYYY